MKTDSVLTRTSTFNEPASLVLGEAQHSVDQAVSAFIDGATDWKSIAAMTAGSGAYRLGKLGVLGLGESHALRFASVGFGLFAEVSAFELTHRELQSVTLTPALSHQGRGSQEGIPSPLAGEGQGEGDHARNLWRWSGTQGLKTGLLSSLVTFGSLKTFGKITHGQNLVLQHLAQDLGLVAGHQLAHRAGAGAKPEGGFALQMIHAEVTTLQLGAGMALAHGLVPGMTAVERGMDLSLRGTHVGANLSDSANPMDLLRDPAQLGLAVFARNGDRDGRSQGSPLQLALAIGPETGPLDSKAPEKPFISQMSGLEKDPLSRNTGPETIETESPASEAKLEFPPELIEKLRKAKRVTVLTGAGLSAESGIPTFRDGAAALWTNVSMDEVATAKAFAKNPDKVWRWHAEQRERLLQAQPNPAHFALAEMEKEIPDFTLITQNIDGLHQTAGSKNVIEIHGNLHRLRCPMENKIVELEQETGERPPTCPDCSSPLRHDVVWFGEQLPQEALNDAIRASHHSEVFLSIGTSSVVNPAAALARRAVATKQTVVEINPNETSLSRRASFVLRAPAGKILPALLEAVWRTPAPDPEASRKEIAARYRPLFPVDYREKILEAALNTEAKQELFQERLLEAYSQDPARGTYRQLMTVLSIRDLFYGDATASPQGSFEAALVQTLIRRAASDSDSSRRNEAFQAIFRGMEDGLNRNTLTALLDRFDYGKDLRISITALYPREFSEAHEAKARQLWNEYRDQDILPLLNLVYESAPTDPVKQRRLIRILSQTRHSPFYRPEQIDAILDHARHHPVGNLMLKRMLQILIVEDAPGKLRDLTEGHDKTDTLCAIADLQNQGLAFEEIARRINGTHHTAYLNDMRLARKTVSTLTDANTFLQDFSGRTNRLNRIRELVREHLASRTEPDASFWLKLMGEDPEGGRSYALAKKMGKMIEEKKLQIVSVSDTTFNLIANDHPDLKGSDTVFFLQATQEGDPHVIVMREFLNFREILERVKGLPHEGTHVMQAIGGDEAFPRGEDPMDFGSIHRGDRLSAEIMAFLEQARWDVINTDVEFWTRAQRLGLNLPLYFLHINDQNIYGETNEGLVSKVMEKPW